MKLKICLAKTILIFYGLLAPPIMVGSAYNLVSGWILGRNPTLFMGAFSLFGFVLLPLGLVNTYRNNICVIGEGDVVIGKDRFPRKDYGFAVARRSVAFKNRPIFSMWKSTSFRLEIWSTTTGKLVREVELSVLPGDITKISAALLAS